LQLVTGFADYSVGDFAPGASLSADGGVTWLAPTGGAILPNPPGFTWGIRTLAKSLSGGDAAVAWGLGQTVFYGTLGFHQNSNPPNNVCGAGGIYIYRSINAGNSWSVPAGRPAFANTKLVFRDKEYIVVDRSASSAHRGTLYLV